MQFLQRRGEPIIAAKMMKKKKRKNRKGQFEKRNQDREKGPKQ